MRFTRVTCPVKPVIRPSRILKCGAKTPTRIVDNTTSQYKYKLANVSIHCKVENALDRLDHDRAVTALTELNPHIVHERFENEHILCPPENVP